LAKIKRKDKITTFDYRISCRNVREIKFSLQEVLELLNLKKGRFGDINKIVSVAEEVSKFKKLKEYLEQNNADLDKYFKAENRHYSENSPETGIQAIDAFATALDIFGLNRHNYTKLTEEQIMDWEIEKMSPLMGSTPDGKHFLEFNSRRLYIQKVHNTPIERCLGVDLIYNFFDEHRVVFIQYKCFNHDNKKYYKSKDTNSEPEIQRMSDFDFIKNCWNFSADDLENLRICNCPFFIKLCSREISASREEPYGYYYTVCVWDRLNKQEKSFINYDDEPKISNRLFKDLVHSGLIGTIKKEAKLINEKLLKHLNDDRLLLIFTEQKVSEN
jgi:hypothetical protein